MKKMACAVALALACATASGSSQDLKPDMNAWETKTWDTNTWELKTWDTKTWDTKAWDTKTPDMKTSDKKRADTRVANKKTSDKKTSDNKKQEPEKPETKTPEEKTPWDIAFGAALMSDYYFRGITQSNHRPSVAAYFEPRYDFTNSLQAYMGVSGESISFPNRAGIEIDFYTGIRPTFGQLAMEYGFWEYWYPGGRCFNTLAVGGPECAAQGPLPNGNVVKADLSYWEVYGKATYTANDQLSFGGSVYWSPSVMNSGAEGTYVVGTAKYILPPVFPQGVTWFPDGIGWFISADLGHWFLGTTDSFYCTQSGGVCAPPFPDGIPFKSYTHWDIGIAFTWKQFTLDLRYFDSNLNKGDCNAFTSDHTAGFDGSFTPINPSGVGSTWCSAAFIAKLSVDLTKDNLK
jgi:hypothetical protein